MMILDRDIDRASALVIDGNPTSRSILMSQLRDIGVGHVAQATRLFPLITSLGFVGRLLGIGVSLLVPELMKVSPVFQPPGLLLISASMYFITLLVFGLARPHRLADLPPFQGDHESSERIIIDDPASLAFSLHARAAGKFLAASSKKRKVAQDV